MKNSNQIQLFFKKRDWPSFIEKNNLKAISITFIILNFLITVPLALILNIWFDEAYSLGTTSGTISDTWSQSIQFEEQAPFYFLLLHTWQRIHSSILWARLLSVTCVGLVIALTPYLSKRFLKNVHPIWVTAAVAFNPFIIWTAVEIRLYALSTLLSGLLLLLFYDAYLSENPNLRSRLIYILTAILSLYTHYFLGFILAVNGFIVILFSRKNKTILTYGLDMIIVGICFAPMILTVISQISMSHNDNASVLKEIPSGLLAQLIGFKKAIRVFLVNTIPAPNPDDWSTLRKGLFSLLLGWAVWWRRSIDQNTWIVWMVTALSLALFSQVFANLGHLGISLRHASAITVLPSLMSIMAVLKLPQGKWRQRSLALGLALLLTLSLGSIWINYKPLAKNGDSIRVASYLKAHETSGQPILVFNPEVEMVLTHYYEGVNELIALPEKENFATFSVYELILQQPQDITNALDQLSQPYDDIWLVTGTGILSKSPVYQESYQLLETFVKDHFHVKTDQAFYGARVRLLKSRSIS